MSDLYKTDPFQKWAGRLAEQIGSAIRDAAAVLQPCRLMASQRAAAGLGVNRRMKTTAGIRATHGKLDPKTIIGPEGPTDDLVRVAALVDRSNRPVAMLVNFTTHPVLEMCIKQVSPDYPGEMCLELQRRHPGAVAFFLQGATGNINPREMGPGAAHAQRFGQRLADVTDAALGELAAIKTDHVAVHWRTIQLPARTVTGEAAPDPLEMRIGVLRIGEAAFVCLPGEPFVEIALAIREASPWKFTAVVGYADDYIGYIPTDLAFRNGGYEIGPGRWSRVAAGSEAIVSKAAAELLREL